MSASMSLLKPSVRRRAGLLLSISVLALVALAAPPAQGQTADPASATAQVPPERMMLEADTLIYDLENDRVSAVGRVVIYYGGYVVMSDRVEVDRNAKTVSAVGSVHMTDPTGNVVEAGAVELADDLSAGIIESLELLTRERTAFRARRATRSDDDVTVFEEGEYEACVNCDGVPGKKPIWTIKAKRVVHRQGEKTVTLEDATFEFAGVPIAWVPKLTQPDPSVKRRSGFLIPNPTFDQDLGFGLTVPYFWALAPNMDVTFRPAAYSRQGVLADVEWRHRVDNGEYSLRVAGIRQASPGAFTGTTGDTDWRAAVYSTGRFAINQRWNWGWNVTVASDRSFLDDYDLPNASNDAATSSLYLTGFGDRSLFDAHLYGFFVQQEDDASTGLPQDVSLQSKQPFVHPVVDYEKILDRPVFGGEVSITSNFTSLTRQKDDVYSFDNGNAERFRGVGGTFSRASIELMWKRQMTDPLGQVFTPFAGVSADAFFLDTWDDSTSGLASNDVLARATPVIGLEYAYPFLVSGPFGDSVIAPTAQIVARPSERLIGEVPNEDAQSLVFDESSLFDIDKFSGFDRREGGTRLNLGFRQTTNLATGGSISAIAGQSFHLAGENSYAASNIYATGVDSGLESDRSDYVAGLVFNTNVGLLAGARARFDDETFNVRRAEAQVLALSGPLTTSLTYVYLEDQPDLGVPQRSEMQGAASLRLSERWRLFGAARYDIVNDDFVRNAVGIGYDDEAFSASISYSEDRTSSSENTDRTVFLRLGFRTLGDVSTSADLGD
jgi:Organic solvent tolerance protein OstA